MGPRPSGRGNPDFFHGMQLGSEWLQWGLDLPVEETSLHIEPCRQPRAELQWGLDLPVEETSRASSTRSTKTSGFNGASTFRSRKHDVPGSGQPPQWGFNGASTFRSRKLGRHPKGPLDAHCFNGASTFRSRKQGRWRPRRLRLPHASMGPRPSGRGNMTRRMRSSALDTRFNGASTFRSRKP